MVALMYRQSVGVDIHCQLAALLRTCISGQLPGADQKASDAAEKVCDPNHRTLGSSRSRTGRLRARHSHRASGVSIAAMSAVRRDRRHRTLQDRLPPCPQGVGLSHVGVDRGDTTESYMRANLAQADWYRAGQLPTLEDSAGTRSASVIGCWRERSGEAHARVRVRRHFTAVSQARRCDIKAADPLTGRYQCSLELSLPEFLNQQVCCFVVEHGRHQILQRAVQLLREFPQQRRCQTS